MPKAKIYRYSGVFGYGWICEACGTNAMGHTPLNPYVNWAWGVWRKAAEQEKRTSESR